MSVNTFIVDFKRDVGYTKFATLVLSPISLQNSFFCYCLSGEIRRKISDFKNGTLF